MKFGLAPHSLTKLFEVKVLRVLSCRDWQLFAWSQIVDYQVSIYLLLSTCKSRFAPLAPHLPPYCLARSLILLSCFLVQANCLPNRSNVEVLGESHRLLLAGAVVVLSCLPVPAAHPSAHQFAKVFRPGRLENAKISMRCFPKLRPSCSLTSFESSPRQNQPFIDGCQSPRKNGSGHPP